MQLIDDIEKKFLTRDEAARFLGLRPQTLANLTWQNTGPPYVRLFRAACDTTVANFWHG